MKKQILFSLVLFSLFILVVGLYAEISFRINPVISDGSYDECVKYIDVVTGTETWSERKVAVVVAASMDGLGEDQGTLKNVTILGQTYTTHQDNPEYVGTKDKYDSWTAGRNKNVGAIKKEDVPDVKGTYSWSSDGEITLKPWVWQESISIGGRISIPAGASGSYSTSGTWVFGTSTTRSAVRKSGTHVVKFRYKCDACQQSGDTAASIGGREAHIEGECPGSDCSVRYRKCTPPVGHKIIVCPGSGCSVEYRECSVPEGHRPCPSCGTRECEVSNKASSGCSVCQSPTTTRTSSESLHPCGEHLTSASGDHSLQASCSTDANCLSTNFYLCQHDSHDYGCRHTPVHAKVGMPCGAHSDYSCQQTMHRLLSCPTDQGRTCEYQAYYACSPHTHAYAGEPLRPCGHPVSAISPS